jgi:hypothetical protein
MTTRYEKYQPYTKALRNESLIASPEMNQPIKMFHVKIIRTVMDVELQRE